MNKQMQIKSSSTAVLQNKLKGQKEIINQQLINPQKSFIKKQYGSASTDIHRESYTINNFNKSHIFSAKLKNIESQKYQNLKNSSLSDLIETTKIKVNEIKKQLAESYDESMNNNRDWLIMPSQVSQDSFKRKNAIKANVLNKKMRVKSEPKLVERTAWSASNHSNSTSQSNTSFHAKSKSQMLKPNIVKQLNINSKHDNKSAHKNYNTINNNNNNINQQLENNAGQFNKKQQANQNQTQNINNSMHSHSIQSKIKIQQELLEESRQKEMLIENDIKIINLEMDLFLQKNIDYRQEKNWLESQTKSKQQDPLLDANLNSNSNQNNLQKDKFQCFLQLFENQERLAQNRSLRRVSGGLKQCFKRIFDLINKDFKARQMESNAIAEQQKTIDVTSAKSRNEQIIKEIEVFQNVNNQLQEEIDYMNAHQNELLQGSMRDDDRRGSKNSTIYEVDGELEDDPLRNSSLNLSQHQIQLLQEQQQQLLHQSQSQSSAQKQKGQNNLNQQQTPNTNKASDKISSNKKASVIVEADIVLQQQNQQLKQMLEQQKRIIQMCDAKEEGVNRLIMLLNKNDDSTNMQGDRGRMPSSKDNAFANIDVYSSYLNKIYDMGRGYQNNNNTNNNNLQQNAPIVKNGLSLHDL